MGQFSAALDGVVGLIIVVCASAFLMSSVILAQWVGYDIYLESKIEPLDRNRDGFLSAEEKATWTDEDHKNMDAYIGDGGRNVFSVIIFPVFSVVYSLFVSSIYFVVALFISKRKNA